MVITMAKLRMAHTSRLAAWAKNADFHFFKRQITSIGSTEVCPHLSTECAHPIITLLYTFSSSQIFGPPHGSSVSILAILGVTLLNPIMSFLKYLVIRIDFQTYIHTTALLCTGREEREIVV